MRRLLCVLALATSLCAQTPPDFAALAKQHEAIREQMKTATPAQLIVLKQKEDVILRQFNEPKHVKYDAELKARHDAWVAKKVQERKDFCAKHPEEKSCK